MNVITECHWIYSMVHDVSSYLFAFHSINQTKQTYKTNTNYGWWSTYLTIRHTNAHMCINENIFSWNWANDKTTCTQWKAIITDKFSNQDQMPKTKEFDSYMFVCKLLAHWGGMSYVCAALLWRNVCNIGSNPQVGVLPGDFGCGVILWKTKHERYTFVIFDYLC